MAKDRVERDEEDLVRLYLTDIGQYMLLTKDDEVRLAKQIEAGKAAIEELDQIGKDLTAAKKRELQERMMQVIQDLVDVSSAQEELLAQAEAVAGEIARLLREHATIRDRHTGVRRPIGPGDIGVLFRTRESHALFEAVERFALKQLPAEPYVFAEWKQCKAGLDYHVEVEKHYYSVPHALLRETLWARITARAIELFHRGKRVAAHVRSSSNRKPTTVGEHMPSSHRRYAEWTPERLKRRAGEIGPNTATLVEVIIAARTHPEQGFRSSIGIIGLAKRYGPERLEAACARALEIGARSYTSVASILKNNLDRTRPEPATDGPAISHSNIRGAKYFH